MILQGICEYLNLEIPKTVEFPSLESVLFDENATIEDFKEFVNLVSRGSIQEEELNKYAENLLKISMMEPRRITKVQKNIMLFSKK